MSFSSTPRQTEMKCRSKNEPLIISKDIYFLKTRTRNEMKHGVGLAQDTGHYVRALLPQETQRKIKNKKDIGSARSVPATGLTTTAQGFRGLCKARTAVNRLVCTPPFRHGVVAGDFWGLVGHVCRYWKRLRLGVAGLLRSDRTRTTGRFGDDRVSWAILSSTGVRGKCNCNTVTYLISHGTDR